MNKTLVLFDFDGTLTKGDTFPQFIFFSQGFLKGMLGFIIYSPFVFLFLTKLMDGSRLKEKLVSYFFKGEREDVLKMAGTEFIQHLKKKDGLNEVLVQELNKYKAEGCTVGIVSASLDIWLSSFCAQSNVDCLCTEIEYVGGICTGNLRTPNCNREEKVIRIKQKYNLSEYSNIIAYGNSRSDRYMFDLANEKHKV